MSRAVRVLQVFTLDGFGGAEAMGLSVFPRMDPARWHVEVAFMDTEGPIGKQFQELGIPVHHFPRGRVAGLVRLARRSQADIVHFYGYRVAALGRLIFALMSPRTKRVLGVRHLYPYERATGSRWGRRLLDFIERLMSRLTHLYAVNSRGAADRLARHGVPTRKIVYVPNGLDLAAWRGHAGRTAHDPPRVVCVARFVSFKRHLDLLDALALVQRRGTPFTCELIGSGPLEDQIKKKILELDLRERVLLAGSLVPDEVKKHLFDADVFALASDSEGMPRSAMEAMATGLPIVGTDVNGTRDVVEDGTTGYLVPFGDTRAFADALDRVLRDEGLRRRLGEAARLRIETEFSLDKTVALLEECYERVVDTRDTV